MSLRFKGAMQDKLYAFGLGAGETEMATWVPSHLRRQFTMVSLLQAIEEAEILSYHIEEMEGLPGFLAELNKVYTGRRSLAEISFDVNCPMRQKQLTLLVEQLNNQGGD